MKTCNHLSSSIFAQRERLLKRLREKPISTIEARKELDILMPAARIFELRRLGHNIITNWQNETTSEGNVHNVAQYALLSGTYNEKKKFREHISCDTEALT
jgi:hypothetical protein